MRFFPGVKVRGSVAVVMAASVFAAGVAALVVLMVVVAAANVGVILKNIVYEGGCAGTQGTTRSTEIYLSIREADLTVGQKKKCGEEAKREIMGWKE